MLTELDRRKRHEATESRYRRRAQNLLEIVANLGGFERAALFTGKSKAKLQQLCLPEHPWKQSIGDTMARELERCLRMVPGGLDLPQPKPTRKAKL